MFNFFKKTKKCFTFKVIIRESIVNHAIHKYSYQDLFYLLNIFIMTFQIKYSPTTNSLFTLK